jgi:hypothetical protein
MGLLRHSKKFENSCFWGILKNFMEDLFVLAKTKHEACFFLYC